jgi:hypothetical protein
MKQVYTATTLAEAELLRVLLRQNRIPSMLEGDSGMIRGPATSMTICVADRYASKAEEVVRRMLLKRKRKVAASRQQGYRVSRPAPSLRGKGR